MTSDDDFLKEMRKEYLEEVSGLLEECEESFLKLDKPDCSPTELDKIFRLAHSIKGTGAAVGFCDLASFAHCVEDCLDILRSKPFLLNQDLITLLLHAADEFKNRIESLKSGSDEKWNIEQLKEEIVQATLYCQTRASLEKAPKKDITHPTLETTIEKVKSHSNIKVDSTRIDSVLDLVGELIVIKGQLLEETVHVTNQRYREILALLDKTARELQDKTLSMRLTALRPLFIKVQRIVRDLSLQLDKPIEFSMEGEDIEMDRSMIDLLADPLVHIIRNAIDHGIEPKQARTNVGKSEVGTIKVSAKHSSGRILVEIQDDGNGIDRVKVVEKARTKGLIKDSINTDLLTDEAVFQYIFLPGFSTAEKVSDISGRGVGLDVVKNNIEKMKGSIKIKSENRKGTTFQISLPLTTAVTDGIVVLINDERFIVQMNKILEIVELNRSEIQQITSHNRAAIIRGQVLPIIPLTDIFSAIHSLGSKTDHAPSSSNRAMILVIECNQQRIALQVDKIIGQNQVVIKPLENFLKAVTGLAGASILGDGRIALVLDLEALSNQLHFNHTQFISQKIAVPNQDQL